MGSCASTDKNPSCLVVVSRFGLGNKSKRVFDPSPASENPVNGRDLVGGVDLKEKALELSLGCRSTEFVPFKGGQEPLSLPRTHETLLLPSTLVIRVDGGIKSWNANVKRVVCHLSTTKEFPSVLDWKCSPVEPIFVFAAATRRFLNNPKTCLLPCK